MTDNQTTSTTATTPEPMTAAKADATVDGKLADTKADVGGAALTSPPATPAATDAQRPHRFDPFDPFELFDELQQDMARLWSQTFPLLPRPLGRPLRRMAPAPSAWLPRMDVYEKDGKMVVTAELPGMKKEDIDITLEQGDLVIRGERHAESELKEDAYYRAERSYGRFYRRIPLGFEVKADQIEARYGDGVLEVQVPLPAQEKPAAQKIAVQ